jgi:DNA-binding CsgD family transcriptional regulator
MDPLVDGREAMVRLAWGEAVAAFRAADAVRALGVDDLERAGLAAHLTGDDENAAELLARGHHAALDAGDHARAARFAFWTGMMFAQHGDEARGGAWIARAARLVIEHDLDTVERGYVLIPQGLGLLGADRPADALGVFAEAARIGERFGDPDLRTFSQLGMGRALIDQSETAAGVARLDEAMLAVTSGEVSPVVVGVVYCAAIEGFQAIFDLRRAQAWTDLLRAWCDRQPDLVPFRGRCLVYRAELMLFHGAWPEASDEAQRAQEWLSRPPPEPAVGEAFYQQAELHRLRGQRAAAESAYGAAAKWGRRTEPGLALLRLDQGKQQAAAAIIGRALDESISDIDRARLLGPSVEIALDGGDIPGARAASNELTRVAEAIDAPLLQATAAQADGLVLLAEGDARGALRALRRAWKLWDTLDAPYESARVRRAIALAMLRLGDRDTANLELDAARRVFSDLGAGPDLARLDALTGERERHPSGLSTREVEVLQQLAAGRTNRQIAETLGISARTVDRHVSNIFTKIDVSTRAAATAFAYENGLA